MDPCGGLYIYIYTYIRVYIYICVYVIYIWCIYIWCIYIWCIYIYDKYIYIYIWYIYIYTYYIYTVYNCIIVCIYIYITCIRHKLVENASKAQEVSLGQSFQIFFQHFLRFLICVTFRSPRRFRSWALKRVRKILSHGTCHIHITQPLPSSSRWSSETFLRLGQEVWSHG